MPRILTNKFNLPETIVKAIQYDTHKVAGTISVTTLIDAPQIRILKKLHKYEEDAIDGFYALMGTALHHVLERANIDSVRKRAFILTAETIMNEADRLTATDEAKATALKNGANWIFKLLPAFFPEIEERYVFERTLRLDMGDQVLSGTFDLYDKTTGILYDYKLCSVYAYMFPESREKWFAQTNIYAYMLQMEGFPVNGIKVVAFFRDWSKHGLIRDKEYPERQIKEIDVPLGNPNNTTIHWTEQVKAYIDKRVDIHSRAEKGEVIECNGKERWAKSDQYAVKTPTSKRSLRNHDSLAAANVFIQENRHKHDKMFVEKRPGGSMRCEEYCPVAKFCGQRKRELENASKLE